MISDCRSTGTYFLIKRSEQHLSLCRRSIGDARFSSRIGARLPKLNECRAASVPIVTQLIVIGKTAAEKRNSIAAARNINAQKGLNHFDVVSRKTRFLAKQQ